MQKVNVLFVCMGNICRSPVAEGVFSKLVAEAGLSDSISVDSAGTGAWHLGHAPDSRAQTSAKRRGIDISRQRSRLIEPEDLSRFDYVLTMDEYNFREVSRLGSGGAVVRRFMDFHPDASVTEVPDPYYGEGDGFTQVMGLVEEASAGLLAEIRKRRSAS